MLALGRSGADDSHVAHRLLPGYPLGTPVVRRSETEPGLSLVLPFEQVLKRGINAGLVSGEGFAVDASVVRADASRHVHQRGGVVLIRPIEKSPEAFMKLHGM
jgi:hypothetical protein